MKKLPLILVTLFLIVTPLSVFGASVTFNKGIGQTFAVPAGITTITVDMTGAQGADDPGDATVGGKGGRVQFTTTITPGSTLYINVGGKDGTSSGGIASSNIYGNGGGLTSISTTSTLSSTTVMAVAPGGGGAADTGNGGYGDTPTGQAGQCTGTKNGGAGTQTVGGVAGDAGATAGSAFHGGNGNPLGNGSPAGGGGLFGGGGAGRTPGIGCGGGASGFLSASLTATSTTGNFQSNDGYLTITYTLPPVTSDVTIPASAGVTFNSGVIIK